MKNVIVSNLTGKLLDVFDIYTVAKAVVKDKGFEANFLLVEEGKEINKRSYEDIENFLKKNKETFLYTKVRKEELDDAIDLAVLILPKTYKEDVMEVIDEVASKHACIGVTYEGVRS
ncbi:hypothetical protein [Flammeovirga agarivorans]|uniref:Uncharacterized protein n=1 Tax=Flammeovirga agarivorans TaxID=2726742 RepID=A0A7X8XZF0_9BACT|nr:hypothetical protein [Flammeovirga agarivorans]NLR94925.1 hypothetical protein [Flammeovirga agarivorans]